MNSTTNSRVSREHRLARRKARAHLSPLVIEAQRLWAEHAQDIDPDWLAAIESDSQSTSIEVVMNSSMVTTRESLRSNFVLQAAAGETADFPPELPLPEEWFGGNAVSLWFEREHDDCVTVHSSGQVGEMAIEVISFGGVARATVSMIPARIEGVVPGDVIAIHLYPIPPG